MRGSHCGSSSYDECAQEIRTGRTGQVYAGYRISYNRNGSVSFGTETWEYFGTLPGIEHRATLRQKLRLKAMTGWLFRLLAG
jgi:hypothetical protein